MKAEQKTIRAFIRIRADTHRNPGGIHVNTTDRNNRISRDIAVCALIVLASILLHSLSLPLLYVAPDARDEYRTESGLPYLTELDSYLYCRLTEDLAEGDISDYTLRHSRGDDPYISANATGEEGDVVMGLPILGATVYKLLSWIPGVTPYNVIYWLAPFLASFAAIPVYFFVSRRLRRLGRSSRVCRSHVSSENSDPIGAAAVGIRSGRLGGLVAAVLVVAAGAFSWHTHAGFYDTDMGLALLPCAFLLCYAEALLAKDLRRRIAWGFGSGLALCALSTFWRAYYAYFCIGAAAAFCTVFAVLLAFIFRKIRMACACGNANATGTADASGPSGAADASGLSGTADASDPSGAADALVASDASDRNSESGNSIDTSTNPAARSTMLTAVPGALIGLAAQVLCCLLVRGTEFFRDIAGIAGNVGGSLANGDTSYPDAGSFVSELRQVSLLADGYGNSTSDRILNGFAAYAEGTLNKLGAWPVLIVTAVTAAFLVYWGCRIVFTGVSVSDASDRAIANGADSEPSSSENAPPSESCSSRSTVCDLSGELLITAVFLGVWLACGLFIMLKGARFVTIPVLPVSVVCGLGLGLLHLRLNAGKAEERSVSDTVSDNPLAACAPTAPSARPTLLRNALYIGIIALAVAGWAFAVRPEFGTVPCIIAGAAALAIGIVLYVVRRAALINLLAVTLIFSPIMACVGGSYSAIPDGTDTLQAMCDAIREQTEPDAVIASWWDYGYFYEYAAKRLTLGDGGNFNGEWNYWLGQALMTDDVTLTKGICRMLASCGLDASHLLMERYKKDGADYARRATDVLKTILPLRREEAYCVLTGKPVDAPIDPALAERDLLDTAAANELLALTHPAETHPIYLVLSEDMLHKIGAIGTFGRWDFSGNNPSTPYVRRTDSATVIEPGQSAEITFPDCGYTLHVERDSSGDFTNCSLHNKDGNKTTVTIRVVPLEGGSADNAMTDEPLPRFAEAAAGAFTVYLREDSPSTYRSLLCDSYGADFIIIRGFMMNGNTLLYRGVTEIPESNGSTSLHEVAVWELGQ